MGEQMRAGEAGRVTRVDLTSARGAVPDLLGTHGTTGPVGTVQA